MSSQLAQAKQKLVQAANNPAVPKADRLRLLNALVISNEPSRPKAQRQTATAPVAPPRRSIEALMLSVIGDPGNTLEEQLRASRGLTAYYRDQEISERQVAAQAANEQRMLASMRAERTNGEKLVAVRVTNPDGSVSMTHEFR